MGLNLSNFLNRMTVSLVLILNGCIFNDLLNRDNITTCDVTYCYDPLFFVVGGTVTRSTRPVVDCSCNTHH